jgi:mycofactocin system transcriptional regulator
MLDQGDAPARGRPPSITAERIAHVALELFAVRGFEETTVDDIAAELAVSRRTIFRYFPSKNDMVWGDFELVLERLRRDLDAIGDEVPTMDAIARAAVSSNEYDDELLPELRIRLQLITGTPALQAHSMLRYADWRAVIAEYAARRRGESPHDLIPQTIAHAALGTSIAAFSRWVQAEDQSLRDNLRQGYTQLAAGFALVP